MSAPGPRVGLGVDLHGWDPGRPLLLGGVSFEGEPGLAGHSDGDVVCHAVADALLGAAGLADLGAHFPDDDPAFAGMAGLALLERVMGMVTTQGIEPTHVDTTVLAERPAIGPRREAMVRALAGALGLDPEHVSVKATRPEGLGLTGDGIGCLAVALVQPRATG